MDATKADTAAHTVEIGLGRRFDGGGIRRRRLQLVREQGVADPQRGGGPTSTGHGDDLGRSRLLGDIASEAKTLPVTLREQDTGEKEKISRWEGCVLVVLICARVFY